MYNFSIFKYEILRIGLELIHDTNLNYQLEQIYIDKFHLAKWSLYNFSIYVYGDEYLVLSGAKYPVIQILNILTKNTKINQKP